MKKACFLSLVLLILQTTFAQDPDYEYLLNKNNKLISDVDFFGSLQHHHQDFFQKAFSYQGIESGVILNRRVMAGVFASTFASNLRVKVQSQMMYITSWKTGVMVGTIQHPAKVLHTGWQLYAGYFSLKADKKELKVLGNSSQDIWVSGMVLVPEVYAEANILKWLKFRTGLNYSFYSFENQSEVSSKDLNGIALNFGFIFFN